MRQKMSGLLLALAAGMLMVACSGAKQTACVFGDNVDSIKVEVSSKVGGTRSILLSEKAAAVARFENGSVRVMSGRETKKLISLADSLFVTKSRDIIKFEEKAEGRTDYPLFTVTIYRSGKGESTRYEMGTEDDGITRGTTRNIRYSDTFRDFMQTVFNVLKL